MSFLKLKHSLIKHERTIELRGPESFAEYVLVTIWNAHRKIKRYLLHSHSPLIIPFALTLKEFERTVVSGRLNFVTFAELIAWTIEWSKNLPRVDLVVAIPRSGLFVGSILAFRQATALSTPEQSTSSVWRSRHIPTKEIRHILLVDDSVSTGRAIKEARALVMKSYPNAKIETAALIASSVSKHLVDYVGIIIEQPRLFEWNFLHANKGVTAFDIDGVLSEDPPESGLRLHMPRYREWIKNAKPFLIPTYKIDAIISNRPESVRQETEQWLANNGVRYDKLILDQNDTIPESKYDHKVTELRILKPDLFIESSLSEAKAISQNAKVPVLCIENTKMYYPFENR